MANDNALPVELTLNKLTRETLAKSARGEEVNKAEDAEDLFHQLGI